MYSRDRTNADRSEIDPVVRQRIHDYLADLAIFGILDRQSRNERGRSEQYYEYEFSVDLRTVQELW